VITGCVTTAQRRRSPAQHPHQSGDDPVGQILVGQERPPESETVHEHIVMKIADIGVGRGAEYALGNSARAIVRTRMRRFRRWADGDKAGGECTARTERPSAKMPTPGTATGCQSSQEMGNASDQSTNRLLAPESGIAAQGTVKIGLDGPRKIGCSRRMRPLPPSPPR